VLAVSPHPTLEVKLTIEHPKNLIAAIP